MFFATINKARRLLYLSYIGDVRAGELQNARVDGAALLLDLPAGMRVLADFERMDTMCEESISELGKLMEMCDEKGVELVVRVIPDASKDIGLNILAAFHYRKPVRTVTCHNMQEAAAALGL